MWYHSLRIAVALPLELPNKQKDCLHLNSGVQKLLRLATKAILMHLLGSSDNLTEPAAWLYKFGAAWTNQ